MRITRVLVTLFGVLGFAASAMADLKITTRHTFGGHSREMTQYIKGDHKRLEYRSGSAHAEKSGGPVTWVYGPHIASIQQCDTGKGFELNLDAHEYTWHLLPKWPTAEERKALAAKHAQLEERPKATVTIEITTIDTGERKQIFGRTARHVITTIKHIPHEGAVSEPSEQVNDGWYIDLDVRTSCEPQSSGAVVGVLVPGSRLGSGKQDTYEFKQIGPRETGYPVQLAVKSPDGAEGFTSGNESEVIELSDQALDPALFEVPSDFKLVAEINVNPPAPPQ